MRPLHALLAPWSALLLLLPHAAAAADRLVLLVDNRSTNAAAATALTPILTAALARKGYEVVQGPEVDALFRATGALHAESLGAAAAAGLIDQLKARGALAITIRFFLEPQARALGPGASPAMGLTAKAFAPGRATWRNSLGLIADDGAAQPHRSLAATACARLLWSFPRGQGAALASASEDWEALTGSSPDDRVRQSAVPDYDVLIERQRASRAGPRFPLRARKRK